MADPTSVARSAVTAALTALGIDPSDVDSVWIGVGADVAGNNSLHVHRNDSRGVTTTTTLPITTD